MEGQERAGKGRGSSLGAAGPHAALERSSSPLCLEKKNPLGETCPDSKVGKCLSIFKMNNHFLPAFGQSAWETWDKEPEFHEVLILLTKNAQGCAESRPLAGTRLCDFQRRSKALWEPLGEWALVVPGISRRV